MPRKLEVNRDEVKAGYVSGISTAVLSKRYGVNPRTVETWARRENWRTTRANLEKPLNEAVVLTVKDTLRTTSDKLKLTLANHLNSTAETLAEMKPRKGLDSLNSHADVIQKLATAASKVHGWNESAAPAVQVNLISGLIELDAQTAQTQETVNVESTTEPTEAAPEKP